MTRTPLTPSEVTDVRDAVREFELAREGLMTNPARFNAASKELNALLVRLKARGHSGVFRNGRFYYAQAGKVGIWERVVNAEETG
jgi:hypothetical protein